MTDQKSEENGDEEQGATTIELIAVIAAVLVIGVFLIRSFLAMTQSDRPDKETAVQYLLAEVLKIPDSAADITGKLYTQATLDGITSRLVTEAQANYAINYPEQLRVGAFILNCEDLPDPADPECVIVADQCSQNVDSTGNCPDTGTIDTEVTEYARNLSLLSNAPLTGNRKNAVQIEVLAIYNEDSPPTVIKSQLSLAVMPIGGVFPKYIMSPIATI